MILYYIRHGEPIYDPDCLTELGHKQADAVSKRLALYGVDEIYSSTSIRARQTAEPLNTEFLLLNEISEKDVSVDAEGFSVIDYIILYIIFIY